jgi:hypothetical protein
MWTKLAFLLAASLFAGCLAGPGSGHSAGLADESIDGADTQAAATQPQEAATQQPPAHPSDGGSANGSQATGSAKTSPNGSVTTSEPAWAPAATALIHPGIQTFTNGAQCTANFVFYDVTGIYIGQAAHCAGTGTNTDTNGCTSGYLPLGTPVDLGTGHDGTLAYESWAVMQDAKTPDSAPECYGNDLALIKVDPRDADKVNPAVPFFGGPVGVGPTAGLGIGDEVYSYGNSELRLGVEPVLAWKHGTVFAADAWTADLYTATPGIPGDSGSGFLDSSGQAIGVLSTISIAPTPASNTIASLQSDLAYREAHGFTPVTLATAPFTGGIA